MTVRTAHRQFGSKARVAVELLDLLPPNATVWVEGFAGTAALTLAKTPHPSEHLNDLNGAVVNLFRVLRDDAARDRLCRLVDLTPYAEAEFRACCAATWGGGIDHDPVERARQFLVASWQGIGGKQVARSSWRLGLSNSWVVSGWHGVPARLRLVAERLKRAHIHSKHIGELVAMFADRPEAVLFLDPPYPRHTLATHETVYAVDMGEDEHERLAAQLREVRCRILLTMAEDTVYQRLLSDWHVTPYLVRGMRNAIKQELALSNYRPPRTTASRSDLFGFGRGEG